MGRENENKQAVNLEKWLPVLGLNNYEVSNTGKIRSIKSMKSVAIFKRESGYICTGLFHNKRPIQKLVHRLVAEAFISNPENKRTVNHLDDDKTNNNDWNLAWATYSENNKHAYSIGLMDIHGEKHMHAKLDNEKVLIIRKSCLNRIDIKKYANKYSVSESTVYDALKRRTWTHI